MLKNAMKMAPEAVFTNTTDKNDFMKFTKFLALKGVQIIVHSRKGAKVETNYKMPSSDTDWFNLAIQDSVEVTKATKKAFLDDILVTFQNQLCVEISLRTTEGDEMVLETWTFGINSKEPDYSLKAMSTVYYRMGILLKSLISVTRITPAYKLARRQTSDSYSIYYEVYTGSPKIESLGEDSKKVNVGMLRTPIGGLLISLAYRTNMIITTNKQKNELLLKSDHFELSPKHIVCDPNKKKEIKEKPALDLNKPLRAAAFVDTEAVDEIITSFHENIPLPKNRSPVSSVTSKSKPIDIPVQVIEKAQTPVETPPKRFPFIRSEKEPPIELLYCPFADCQPIRELAEFYRDSYNAPRLKSEENEEGEKVDLAKEFEEFDNSAQEFDEMIASMCCSNEGN